ncbi:PREDICTED: tryptophan--tRNA ligase, mitochondrial [Nicrophorus vespilloides]|uniref:tryptophan--tRNA ligase n=1 Tax=Nicrophorus vespilloides TaxID=110193 RepID=A0ABM1M0D9_NICVS|nr:PREDICTED: tryptophan--tRNA ligase, mitochondrial [Nicrophorus vespilloides]
MLLNTSRIATKRFIRQFCNEVNESKYPRKVFSGIQPTGAVHLGNYLGAIKQWTKLQDDNEDMTLSVVDLHSITLPQNPKTLSKNILEMTSTLLACGIDPDKTILFQQSAVQEHTELCWQLGCISTMARLAHLPQYKEKSENLKDIPLGLFVYPVLQAADILIYKATHVPVGEDQLQHLQLSQDLARMFNNRFGETFPIPHSIISNAGNARLKSLRDPLKKMSKSDADPKSRICLLDSTDEIVNKIKKAVTDFTSEVSYDPENRPGVSNLITIHSILSGKSVEQILNESRGLDTGKYKLSVAEDVSAYIKPIREQIENYMRDPQYIVEVLKGGADRARETASRTASEVRRKLGMTLRVKSKTKVKVANQ